MINFFHRCEIFDAVHNKSLKFPPSTSIHFETRVGHSRVVGLVQLHFVHAGSSNQNPGEQFVSCVHLSFVNFALRQTPGKRSLKELGPEILLAVE